jgi:ABC-2 type transport system permease protein
MGALHRAAYGGELLVRSLFLIVILFVFRQLYSRVLPPGSSLGGFDGTSVLWYLVLTEAILISSPRLGGLVDEEVRSGQLASYLVRPLSYLAYHRWRFMGEAGVALPVNLCVGGTLALCLAGLPPLAPWQGLAVLVPVTLGFLMHFHVSMVLALSAFWVEDSTPFFWVYQKVLFILGGLLIPLDFFPPWARQIAEALPFSLVLYGPSHLALQFTWAGWRSLVLRQGIWLVVLVGLAEMVFRMGERRVVIHGG